MLVRRLMVDYPYLADVAWINWQFLGELLLPCLEAKAIVIGRYRGQWHAIVPDRLDVQMPGDSPAPPVRI